ncbi:MAG: MBL fold metallo-hydrolase [Acutalibacteraceae bacterium]|nr:MBL fold metallo-hydrolase [Acutalibacteraceae bacterium]
MKITVFKYGQSFFAEHNFFADRKGSEKGLPISFLFYLIETGNRRILIDTGCNGMEGWDISHFCSPALLLRKYGLSPLDITDVIITHPHYDHVACAGYFKNAAFLMHINTYAEVQNFLPVGVNVCRFEEDLFTDENIQLIHIGGHCKGSSVVLVTRGEEKLLFCGDEVYSEECFIRNVGSGHPENPDKNKVFIEKYRGDEYKKIVFHTPEILPDQNGFIEI